MPISKAGTSTESGFTLIELAIAIAIIGLLMGALLVPLATHSHASKNRATERDLKEIKEALIGFGISTGRLPCPDTTGNGVEDLVVPPATPPPPPPPYDCVALEGNLPWVMLAAPATDRCPAERVMCSATQINWAGTWATLRAL